jgi:hypothetical protein
VPADGKRAQATSPKLAAGNFRSLQPHRLIAKRDEDIGEMAVVHGIRWVQGYYWMLSAKASMEASSSSSRIHAGADW